ncbi:MAG: YwiC-like family protein, partial [Candidatus Neomarinimicrobiota bacterium]
QTPLTRLIRRRQMKIRLVIWTAIYGLVAATGAGILWMRIPVLSRIYAVALGVLLINLLGVYQKDQKSISNELAVFAGLSLALPFVYTATNGHMIRELLGLWLLCALVLSSPIFTVRIRLSGDEAVAGAMVYYISGLAILLLLVQVDLLPSTVAWTFLIPVVKLVVILLWMDRYRRLKITSIGFVELGLAIAFAVWVGLVFV